MITQYSNFDIKVHLQKPHYAMKMNVQSVNTDRHRKVAAESANKEIRDGCGVYLVIYELQSRIQA